MRLARRTPRAVYRVYDEVSYLAGAGAQGAERTVAQDRPSAFASFPSSALPKPDPSRGSAAPWRRRAAAGTVLVGTVAALATLAALDGAVSHRARRGRGEAGAGRGPLAIRPTLLGARRALGRARPQPRARREDIRGSAAKVARARGGETGRGARHPLPGPARSGDAAGVVVAPSAPDLSAASSAPEPPPARNLEFGFER